MPESPSIIYDDHGHARHFSYIGSMAEDTAPTAAAAAPRTRAATAQEAAKRFLLDHADLFQLPQTMTRSMDVRAAIAPVAEDEALRFESEKHAMDSTVVSYNQTMFGLPIYRA